MDNFEVAKYNGKWSIFDKISKTFSCIGMGKKYCTERVKELNKRG